MGQGAGAASKGDGDGGSERWEEHQAAVGLRGRGEGMMLERVARSTPCTDRSGN